MKPISTNEEVTLAIPGKRLTITSVQAGGEKAAIWGCFLNTSLNGTSTVVTVDAAIEQQSTVTTAAFQPVPVDSGVDRMRRL